MSGSDRIINTSLNSYHRPSGAIKLSNPSSGPVSICGPMPLPRRSDSGEMQVAWKKSIFLFSSPLRSRSLFCRGRGGDWTKCKRLERERKWANFGRHHLFIRKLVHHATRTQLTHWPANESADANCAQWHYVIWFFLNSLRSYMGRVKIIQYKDK
jgi:hypothetical protein